jgi:hypothetical protein
LKWAISLAFAAVTLVSIVAFTLRSGPGEGWRQIAIGGAVLTTMVVIPNVIAALWARKPRTRAAHLAAQHPASIVFESARLGGLQSFLTADGAIDPVQYITVVIEPGGVSFWRDYRRPRVWRSVDAAHIRGVHAEAFFSSNVWRHGLRFTLDDGDVFVPVLGSGLIGIMSPAESEVESLAERTRVILKLG